MTLGNYLPLITSALLVFVVAFGHRAINARLTGSIRNEFDKQRLSFEAQFRVVEEKLKSELRAKEQENSALLQRVLAGAGNRQALLDKRRIEAVEKVWLEVVRMIPYKSLCASVSVINLEILAYENTRNEKAKEFAKMLLTPIQDDGPKKTYGIEERPFLSRTAWALFSAYVAILMQSFAVVKVIETGVSNIGDFLKNDVVMGLLAAALPEREDEIRKSRWNTYYSYVDELEEKLVEELIKSVEGTEGDKNEFERSSKILSQVKNMRPDGQQNKENQ
jgi:hypothetical protein